MRVCADVCVYDSASLGQSHSKGQSHCRTPPENRESSGQGVGTVQQGWTQSKVSGCGRRYEGGVGRSPGCEARGEVVAVQLQGGEDRASGFTVCSRGEVYDGGVAPPCPLGKHAVWGCLIGLGALRLSGCPALRVGVRPSTGVGQDRAVGGRGVLHQHSVLVARWLPGKIW